MPETNMGTNIFEHEDLSFSAGFPGIDAHRNIESNDVGMLESFDSLVTLILEARLFLLHARDHGSNRHLRVREPAGAEEGDVGTRS